MSYEDTESRGLRWRRAWVLEEEAVSAVAAWAGGEGRCLASQGLP